MKPFIFGAGYSGRAYGALLAERGVPVAGTSRTPEKAETLHCAGIKPFVFNGEPSPALIDALQDTTHLVISIAPGPDGDTVLSAMRAEIAKMPELRWIGYLSTVGVYGDHDGAWVDEESECRPVSQRSVQRRAAESAWIDFAREIDRPLAILRLSGIYGPGRNAFVNLEQGKAKRLIKPGQVFNRIHVDDIAGALDFLGEMQADGIYNVTDDEPAPPQDVVEYACSLMKVDLPQAIDFSKATLSPMARSFYGENKRVSNAKLKRAGFTFVHGNYRSALEAMWTEGNWH